MKKILLLLTLFLLVISLSACSGSFAASSWPGLSTSPAGETAFLATQNQVYAINTASGALRWQYPQETDRQRTFFAPPVYTPKDTLLVGDYHNTLVSLNPDTGAETWRFTANGRFVAAPLATENAIYVPVASGDLYALDYNGQPIWSAPFHSNQAFWATPVLDSDRLYISGMDHHIYALNAADGSVIWDTQLDGAINSAPLLQDGVLYVGTFANQVVAVDAQSGNTLWTTPTDGWVWATPQISNDLLLVGDISGTFYALHAADGSVAWKMSPDGPIATRALLNGETAYFTTESGTLYALDPANGTPRWQYAIETGKLYTAPISAQDAILIAPTGSDTLLTAVDAQNGTVHWQFTPKK
ncbi:MAG: hypothetical protein Fur0018_03160 [Anaerolineales bacterium]